MRGIVAKDGAIRSAELWNIVRLDAGTLRALFEPIKFATQRERPNGSPYLSFPSGHASVTFATATVIERHLGWRKAVLAYILATYVATSRLHDNDHWLSDVVFGAAVGTIAGRTVVHHPSDYGRSRRSRCRAESR